LIMPAKDRKFTQELLRRRYVAGIRSPARLAHITGMTEQGVRKALKRYESTGSFEDASRSGRRRLLSADDEKVILEIAASGFQGSAATWAQELQRRRGRRVSPTTLRRVLHRLDFVNRTLLTEPLTPQQQADRLQWCRLHQDDDWKRTLFLDEFTIEQYRMKLRNWVGRGVSPTVYAPRKIQRSRERVSVTYLAAITLKGCIGCFELPQSYTAADLVKCLNDHFLGPTTKLIGKRWRLVWDNDARHRSVNIKQWISQHVHELVPLPAHSPDLNPIENLFKPLKDHVEHGQPRTKEDIRRLVQEIWKRFTDSHAQESYVKSMKERCFLVINANGARIPY